MALKKFELKQSGAVVGAGEAREAARMQDMSWEAYLKPLNQVELMSLRGKIDQKLTGIKLTDVNLVQEMLFQLKKAKELQKTVGADDGTPANQKAQIQNSLGKILTDLVKHQVTVYDSERIKRMEGALIRVLKTLPKKAQDGFFAAYGEGIGADSADTEPVPDA